MPNSLSHRRLFSQSLAALALVIGGALWLSERSGMGMSGTMDVPSAPMEHQSSGESSGLIAPDLALTNPDATLFVWDPA